MKAGGIDDIDKGILFLLQRDARHATTTEMADRLGVSASTIRNRIEQLEDDGIIRGYRPDIDYDSAGIQLHVLLICSVPNPKRAQLAKKARSVHGVVKVQEVLNGDQNLQLEIAGTDTDDMADIVDRLSEMDIHVANSKILKSTHVQPFDHFGENIAKY